MYTLFEAIEKGGIVMLLLCGLSVYSIAVALFKLIGFHRAGLLFGGGADNAAALAMDGKPEKALEALPLRHPATAALQALRDGQKPEYAAAIGNKAFRQTESYIRSLEVVAAIAPLLGLLGTVVGMVKAFSGISAGGANVDPGMLAGGIWEALLTTIAGLAVAIPAMIIAHILNTRAERAREQAEEIAILLSVAEPAVKHVNVKKAVGVSSSKKEPEKTANAASAAAKDNSDKKTSSADNAA